MDRHLQSVFMGKPLLGPEDVKRFRQKLLIPDVLLFAMPGHSRGILGHHFRTMDHIQYKFTHFFQLLFDFV
ncbi:hypothetical protein FMM80_13425 [Schaedlerella arabinosiphila]|uniref:Uncharacterized protein n=1 Tax=Schaedlerella arabinosiphila TaxID=2044587 RepID=A0A9X5C8M3_9FIRM|nr:hypothetical protein [Schaedlerella arabinosiphila]